MVVQEGGLEAVEEERLKEVEKVKLQKGEVARLQEVEDDARLQASEEKMSEEVVAVAVEERPKEVEVEREAINVLLRETVLENYTITKMPLMFQVFTKMPPPFLILILLIRWLRYVLTLFI
uniref:Uncharacterized protein n=1 Tax=Tanacetum cinerariifolium TaxID=118510 RepID=A0A699TVA0_TANCI|nr:hypothetical protein [Tanacetum cinerariifolium]